MVNRERGSVGNKVPIGTLSAWPTNICCSSGTQVNFTAFTECDNAGVTGWWLSRQPRQPKDADSATTQQACAIGRDLKRRKFKKSRNSTTRRRDVAPRRKEDVTSRRNDRAALKQYDAASWRNAVTKAVRRDDVNNHSDDVTRCVEKRTLMLLSYVTEVRRCEAIKDWDLFRRVGYKDEQNNGNTTVKLDNAHRPWIALDKVFSSDIHCKQPTDQHLKKQQEVIFTRHVTLPNKGLITPVYSCGNRRGSVSNVTYDHINLFNRQVNSVPKIVTGCQSSFCGCNQRLFKKQRCNETRSNMSSRADAADANRWVRSNNPLVLPPIILASNGRESPAWQMRQKPRRLIIADSSDSSDEDSDEESLSEDDEGDDEESDDGSDDDGVRCNEPDDVDDDDDEESDDEYYIVKKASHAKTLLHCRL